MTDEQAGCIVTLVRCDRCGYVLDAGHSCSRHPHGSAADATEAPRETVTAEGERLVGGDRNADYGHPFEDFTRVGRILGAILGVDDVPPDRVALCLIGLKLARESGPRPKRDNAVDIAGYARCVELVRERMGGDW